jgi:hypothetical protein
MVVSGGGYEAVNVVIRHVCVQDTTVAVVRRSLDEDVKVVTTHPQGGPIGAVADSTSLTPCRGLVLQLLMKRLLEMTGKSESATPAANQGLPLASETLMQQVKG